MILAIDVLYTEGKGITAGVLFENWESCSPVGEYVSEMDVDEAYIPGQFYKRELPCILRLLHDHALSPDTIIVDGYVFLDGVEKPGLGKRLYDALGGRQTIVGVAKTVFSGISSLHGILRGRSHQPLYITVIGDSLDAAKANVLSMCGEHRIPALLKRADRLCRESAGS